jgi:outer membrane protein OmpA-like peptidoglycan-associated protein
MNGGTGVVQGLFGNKSNLIADKLGDSTGLPSSAMNKIMALAAPLVMGVIGTKITKGGLNAAGLSSFLGNQKSMVSGLVPNGFFGGGEKVADISDRITPPTVSERPLPTKSNSMSWLPIALGALLLVLAGSWFMRGTGPDANTPDSSSVSPPSGADVPQADMPDVNVSKKVPLASEMAVFLGSGQGDVPKRFRIDKLTFATGSSSVDSSSGDEIQKLADTLKAHPTARARIEGYTDNVGPDAANKKLSTERAASVKEQLVSLGIEADRLTAVGYGEEQPVASNANEEGRLQNRRTDIVILQR